MTSLWSCRVCSLQNRSDDVACVQCMCPKEIGGVALSARKAAWEKGGTFSLPAETTPKGSKAHFLKKPLDRVDQYFGTYPGIYLGTGLCLYMMAYAEYRSPSSSRGLGSIFNAMRYIAGPHAPSIALLIFATFLLMMGLGHRRK